MIGRTLSHYRIIAKIGSGGMGDVYVAEDLTLHREVALKVLPTELAESDEARARFEREAMTIAALNHPNIVTVYSVEHADGVRFITMEPWSPDGRWIAFSYFFRWSPEGKRIYFNNERDNDLSVLTLDDGHERQMTNLSGRPGSLRPHGLAVSDRYVYFTWSNDLGDIWVADVVKPKN
jgi:hypothetical protein